MSRLVMTTPNQHEALVSLARARRALRIEYSDDDDVLIDMIAEATALVEETLHYPLPRAAYTEYVPGYGTPYLAVSRVPVMAIAQIKAQGVVVDPATYHVAHPLESGLIYREKVWDWTGKATATLSLFVIPGSEDPSYQVDYTAGYLLDGDNVSRAITISMASGDNSYNDSAAGFPLLVPGDRIRILGAATAGNNGYKTVVTRTASKITVAEAVTTEAAGNPISMEVATLPLGIRRATLDIVRALYLQRQWELTGPRVVQTEGGTAVLNAPSGRMPQSAQDALLPFLRVEVV